MKTERLFDHNPYLREFAAQVVALDTLDGRPAVQLDRTAFYPTGGGQPHDTGALNGVQVVDVIAGNGAIWHLLGADAPAWRVGAAVTGVVDWDRRFDHMQQHTGQHILSEAFIQVLAAETVAFHLGAGSSTIDLNRVDITKDQLQAVEQAANAVIDEARVVSAQVVGQAELPAIPLRKPSKVTEAIRVVEVAGYDWSACGGTHVANTAQIGQIKIVSSERRGAETRIIFLCGRRARADHNRLQALAEGLVARFTAGQHEILDAVDRRAAELQALRKELATLEGEWAASAADALWSRATARGAWRVVSLVVSYPVERAKRVAQTLRANPGAVVLLGVRGERPQLIFARADDVALDVGGLLRVAAAAGGGRGGGRPDWAQGGAPTEAGLEAALATALAGITGGQ